MAQHAFKMGYAISSEEHLPNDIVRHARRAEEIGFTFSLISDHFHPWTDEQGQSPFVWTVLGAIAHNTTHLQIGTGVTCPTIRTHPAIIAHAAATVAAMMPGRFFLGVGTGENLNEHIFGDRWPAYSVRQEMLEEAIHIIRLLWQGDLKTHHGKHYTVENARIYTLPDTPPPIMVAASGDESGRMAGELGDGLISTAPNPEVVKVFEQHGSKSRPRYGKVTVCWAQTEEEARRTAHRVWPTAALQGGLSQELPLPRHFEAAARTVSEDDIAEYIVCGNDPDAYLAKIHEFADAGYDHIYLHQVGPDQEGFFRFYQKQLQPALSEHVRA